MLKCDETQKNIMGDAMACPCLDVMGPKNCISQLLWCFFTRRVGGLKPVGRQYQMLYVTIFGAGFPSDNNLFIVFQQAVIVSVSSIQNIVMVTLLLQFMFSVIGVQLFKVQYFSSYSYFIKSTL